MGWRVWDGVRVHPMLIRWFKPRLRKKPTEDAEGLSIYGPEAYLSNKIADTTAKEVLFPGVSTPGMRAASKYR
jgi:hypothetical protein